MWSCFLLLPLIFHYSFSLKVSNRTQPKGAGKMNNPVHRPFDILHLFKESVEFSRDILIDIRIWDAECYEADSDSSFVLFLGTLSFDNILVDRFHVHSDQFSYYDRESGLRKTRLAIQARTGGERVSNRLQYTDYGSDAETCHMMGREPCAPGADVIFIQFHNEPNNLWSIERIEVDVHTALYMGAENEHSVRYQHTVVRPCKNWMEGENTYQLGPRTGLFFQLKENENMPKIGEWVRDWV